jgi:hypothetical protein
MHEPRIHLQQHLPRKFFILLTQPRPRLHLAFAILVHFVASHLFRHLNSLKRKTRNLDVAKARSEATRPPFDFSGVLVI